MPEASRQIARIARLACVVLLGCALSVEASAQSFDLRASRAFGASSAAPPLWGRRMSARTVVIGGLEWERKDAGGGLHDKDDLYVLAGACPGTVTCNLYGKCSSLTYCQPNERATNACLRGGGVYCEPCPEDQPCLIPEGAVTTAWDWLAQVNGEGRFGFAGKSDWRLPEIAEEGGFGRPELNALRIAPCTSFPCVSGLLDWHCRPGCALPGCSCTGDGWYLSSTYSPDLQPRVGAMYLVMSFQPPNTSLGEPYVPEDGISASRPNFPAHVRLVRGLRSFRTPGLRGARVPVHR